MTIVSRVMFVLLFAKYSCVLIGQNVIVGVVQWLPSNLYKQVTLYAHV